MFSASLSDVSPLLIPILALLIPIFGIVSHHIAKAASERQRHETIREFVRAGQPVPPELLADAQDSGWPRARRDPPGPNRILVPGVINIGIGVGLMGMFAAMSPESWLWAIGLLPLCVGAGLVVLWAVERKRPIEP